MPWISFFCHCQGSVKTRSLDRCQPKTEPRRCRPRPPRVSSRDALTRPLPTKEAGALTPRAWRWSVNTQQMSSARSCRRSAKSRGRREELARVDEAGTKMSTFAPRGHRGAPSHALGTHRHQSRFQRHFRGTFGHFRANFQIFRGKSLKTGANPEPQKIIAPRHALPRIASRGAVGGKILWNATLARF